MLNDFVTSPVGQGVLIAIIAALLLIAAKFTKSERSTIKVLTSTAMLLALAVVLNKITLIKMPQGGSVTPFAMLTLALIGYLYGVRHGVLAGFAFGLIDLMFGGYALNFAQVLLDYSLAFSCLGLAGLFRNDSRIKGYLVGVIGRFICVFLSGVIFWGIYAPEGFNSVTWSIVYNGTYIGGEALLTLALLSVRRVRTFFEGLKSRI